MASLLSFAFSRAFLFPSDQQLDLDLWVEQAELSCTELHQMRAEDNCLFSINPKAGTLSPGQEQMVEFKYRCSCTLCPVPPSRRSLALTFLCVTPGDPRQHPPWEAISCRGGLCHPCLLPAQRWLSGSKLHLFSHLKRSPELTVSLSPPSSHLFIGTDRLSVLFKVSHGREILVRPQM